MGVWTPRGKGIVGCQSIISKEYLSSMVRLTCGRVTINSEERGFVV